MPCPMFWPLPANADTCKRPRTSGDGHSIHIRHLQACLLDQFTDHRDQAFGFGLDLSLRILKVFQSFEPEGCRAAFYRDIYGQNFHVVFPYVTSPLKVDPLLIIVRPSCHASRSYCFYVLFDFTRQNCRDSPISEDLNSAVVYAYFKIGEDDASIRLFLWMDFADK